MKITLMVFISVANTVKIATNPYHYKSQIKIRIFLLKIFVSLTILKLYIKYLNSFLKRLFPKGKIKRLTRRERKRRREGGTEREAMTRGRNEKKKSFCNIFLLLFFLITQDLCFTYHDVRKHRCKLIQKY